MIGTGSSSVALLSREVATALRGRGWRLLIHPFSFDEALRHQGRPLPDDATVLTGRERTRLERALLDWLGYLEDCFLVRIAWMASASERQRMVNPCKAYPVDPGLILVFDRTGRANLGYALETVVSLSSSAGAAR